VFALLRQLSETDASGSCEIPAPILVLPRIFESALCDRLIALYEQGQSRDSGFMRDNVEVFDYSLKRRRDYFIEDEAVRQIVLKRISQCVLPDIKRLFFMKISRMERYLIGCYSAEEEAHFRPHRDNGQTVTAHRRFALSVALNDDFEGGDLVFPEYNQRPHRIPKGWCIAFPCAILHAVTRVTRGRRYVFLPFLYDDAGAAMKAATEAQVRQAAAQ
jgi:predicted 2-oxoglutarate/Fe(II)-dependent dioxygenase YbiX